MEYIYIYMGMTLKMILVGMIDVMGYFYDPPWGFFIMA